MAIGWNWTVKIVSFLLLKVAIAQRAVAEPIALFGNGAIAQNIVPDNTLGEESSTVTPNVEINGVQSDRIEGGAQRGANLFHSFSEFNVENGRGAYFANPAGIENILGRVTGVNPSDILGTLGVQGNADLFLINPNGIVFGENARLDLGGSFYGSTADSVLFPDGVEFSATDTQTEPLLTINVPIGLNIGDNPGEIVNRSFVRNSAGDDFVGLEVTPGKNLTLVGGNVNFEGGEATASGGRIELGGLQQAGVITFNDGSLSFPEDATRADLTLSNFADIDVRGTGGGNIVINARNLSLKGESGSSAIRAGITAASTDSEAQAGDIIVNATDDVTINESVISNRVELEAVGNAGDAIIATGSLSLTNGGGVTASTLGRGNAGSLKITASDTITIDGESSDSIPSAIASQVGLEADGEGGNIIITTSSLSLADGGFVSATTFGQGNAGSVEITANDTIMIDGENSNGSSSSINNGVNPDAEGEGGDIAITTDSLFLTNGGEVDASTDGRGNAGSLKITASGTVTIDGESSDGTPSAAVSQVNPGAEGEGANIAITTGSLSLTNGGAVSSATGGQGNAGSIEITASDTIMIDGEKSDGFVSGVSSGVSFVQGEAGNVTITTGSLSLTNGGFVSSATEGQGNAGSLKITASDTITIDGESSEGFGSTVNSLVNPGAEGNGGNVTITTDSLFLSNDGQVSATTFGQGNAGDVNINASQLTLQSQGMLTVRGGENSNPGSLTITADNITLNDRSSIEADTESGSQGNITINTQLLTLQNNSEISTNATGTATGGNININANDGFIIAAPEENSDITANATQATGGRVFIDAANLYGIEPREQLTPQSDITASSELGSEFSGIVEINTPNVDPNRDLVQLPTQTTETEIVRACSPSDTDKQSEFVIPGRGGLPPSPEAPFFSDSVAVDWITRPPQNQDSEPEVTTNSATNKPIIEAQGWIVDENNEIVLIAHNQNDAWQNLPQCQESGVKGQRSGVQNHSLLPNDSEQNTLIASTQPKSLTAKVPERISIERFNVKGNTVFDTEELTQVLAPYTDKSLSFAELLQVRSAVTDYYTKRGYITSGA